jgi:hypothetical protein
MALRRRGGQWNASTINGSKSRSNGILQNPLYVGRIVWNKAHKVRNPDSGKRVQRSNPTTAWHEQVAPHLAILDHAVFEAAQKRKAERSIGHPTRHRRPRHILSGLLRCGACGGGMSAAGRDKSGRIRVRCSAFKESGICSDPKTFYLSTVETAVLSGLRREMQKPAVLAEYAKAYTEERRRLAERVTKNRSQIERRLAAAQRELDRAITALIKGTLSEEEAEQRIAATRAERDQIKAELAVAPLAEKAVALHPAALKRYERQLERLQETLEAGSLPATPRPRRPSVISSRPSPSPATQAGSVAYK